MINFLAVKKKCGIMKTHGPVYDEVGPKSVTNAQYLLEMKENIAYGPEVFKIKDNSAYKAAEQLKV